MRTKSIYKEMTTRTAPAYDSGIVESIKLKLDAKETEYNEIQRKNKEERAAIERKIEELEIRQENPATLDEYKEIAKEIKENRQYIKFLDAKRKQAANSAISNNERIEIINALRKEALQIQAATAPEIKTKLNEVIELMETYTKEIKELEKLADRAQRLDKSYYGPNVIFCSDMGEKFNDKKGFFGKFVFWFYKFIYEGV